MKWNKALRPSYIISCRIQPDISNLPSSAVVISLVSLCQSWYYHNAISHYDTQFVCNFMLSMKSSNEKHHCFITWSLMMLYRLSSATQAHNLPDCTDIRGGGLYLYFRHRMPSEETTCDTVEHKSTITVKLLLLYACYKENGYITLKRQRSQISFSNRWPN